MPDLRTGRGGRDLDDVEPVGPRGLGEEREIGPGRAPQRPALARVDGENPRHLRSRRAGLHLDKGQGPAVEDDEVDLVATIQGAAPVAGDNPAAEAPLEEGFGQPLAPGAAAGGREAIACPAGSASRPFPGRPSGTPDRAFHGHGAAFILSVHSIIMASHAAAPALPYKIAVLVFLENARGEHLLLLRAKPPNQGVWSPIGGKLETGIGESPFECAIREAREETGHVLSREDLHLFAIIAEKAYEGQSHWLLFLFRCRKPVAELPEDFGEGKFGFFSRDQVDRLPIPDTDKTALWPTYDRYRDRFVMLRADCAPDKPLKVEIEQIT